MVGVAELESTTSCAQGRRSTRLSYTPKKNGEGVENRTLIGRVKTFCSNR